MSVPDAKLNTGATMPRVGFGLWKNKDEAEFHRSVQTALAVGYRHFDTAQIYGNEQFLGAALGEAGVARDELFVTTKIHVANFSPGRLERSFDESLEKLRMDYVDLLLLHFPVPLQRKSAWRKLEELHASGRAKAIGVSNYTIRHLEKLLGESNVVPAVNQVELHVFLQQPELLAYCQGKGITAQAYSPLAHGNGLDDPVLQAIAAKHGKTTAQVMIRWCIQAGAVPLPKSANPDRIKQNIDIFDFELDDEDIAQVKTLDRGMRTCWDPTHVP